MTDAQEAYFAHRVKYLPGQLAAARRKVRALEAEAKRYGMTDLLIDLDGVWVAEIESAYRAVTDPQDAQEAA